MAAQASAAAPNGLNGSSSVKEYRTVVEALLKQQHVFFSPPTSPHKPLIPQKVGAGVPTISSLSLHPVVESLLHLLNCDLPAAHFLCRHAEVKPKFESMFVHGMLHRIEGDIDNTRAWYGDVNGSEVFQSVWKADGSGVADDIHSENVPEIARKGWKHYLDRIERYRDRTRKRQGTGGWEQDQDRLNPKEVTDWQAEESLLRETSLWEIRQLMKFCEKKFGLGVVADAKSEFMGRIESGDEEQAKMAQNMVTGGEGWRTF